MIINRHNYEEFFLLYVDDELEASNRRAVENFVEQNPDLKQELEMLNMSRLEHDQTNFEHKQGLYKKESGISLTNFKEYFLLSVDNELSGHELGEVEKFVLKHPELQEEFTVLKQARLEPEVMVFAGKDKLYRKEKKERRVAPLVWMRMSIAAAVMGLVAAAWLINHDRVDPSPLVVVPVINTKKTLAKEPQQKVAVLPNQTPKAPVTVVVTTAPVNRKNANPTVIEKQETRVVADPVQNSQPKATDNNIAQIKQAPVQEKPQPAPVIENTLAANEEANKKNTESLLVSQPDKKEPEQFINAVYREVVDNSEDDKSFLIGSAEINKNKLKGLLKKAAGLFEKKAGRKDREKTLQIAGFEIKS